MNKSTTLAYNLRKFRFHKAWTQNQLAQALSIKRSLVGAYEESRAYPNVFMALKISKLLGISMEELISDDFDPSIQLEPDQDTSIDRKLAIVKHMIVDIQKSLNKKVE